MAYFPIFTDIANKKCLIVGGGRVALRKVETLLRYQADVRVIGRQICQEIRQLLPDCACLEGELNQQDLADAVLVVAATSDRQANHQIYEWCVQAKIPVNVIDAPEECTFLFPAVVKMGDISIGINTGGQSPIVSSRIRKEIEKAVPDYYEAITCQLGGLRVRLKSQVEEEKKRRILFKALAAQCFELERPLTEDEIESILKDTL